MSGHELKRVEVMVRVKNGDLKLSDASVMLNVSYRQAKRLWRRYREVGSKGLKHGNVGRPSNRRKPLKERRRVLHLIGKKYSGSEEERFGPTLAAERLAEEDGIVVDHETLRLWMLEEGLWSRIERANGVHQDRLIKKMRRKKIASYEAANQYLQKQYVAEHNRRFARPSASPEDDHGRKPSVRELHEIFRFETERSISNDWVIRHEGRSLQLNPGSRHYGPTQRKALVCEWEDGQMQIYYRGERIAFTELKQPVQA